MYVCYILICTKYLCACVKPRSDHRHQRQCHSSQYHSGQCHSSHCHRLNHRHHPMYVHESLFIDIYITLHTELKLHNIHSVHNTQHTNTHRAQTAQHTKHTDENTGTPSICKGCQCVVLANPVYKTSFGTQNQLGGADKIDMQNNTTKIDDFFLMKSKFN